MVLFFVKQKRTYEVRIRDWSSDGCSSDRVPGDERLLEGQEQRLMARVKGRAFRSGEVFQIRKRRRGLAVGAEHALRIRHACCLVEGDAVDDVAPVGGGSEARRVGTVWVGAR